MAKDDVTKHLLLEHTTFPYQFYFKKDASCNAINSVDKWCVENCQGRWMTVRAPGYNNANAIVDFMSAAKSPSPVPGISEAFPAAEITITVDRVLCFELECDATAFKLEYL